MQASRSGSRGRVRAFRIVAALLGIVALSGMVEAALAIRLTVITSSLEVSWRRTGAWLVGAAVVGLGLGSLVVSDHLGAFDPLSPWLSVTLGVVVVALAEVDARARRSATVAVR